MDLQLASACSSSMWEATGPGCSIHCVLWNFWERGIEHAEQSLTAAQRLLIMPEMRTTGSLQLPCKLQAVTAHSKSSQCGCSAYLGCSYPSGALGAGVSPQILNLLLAVLVDMNMHRLSFTLLVQWRWQPAQSTALRQLWPQSEK